MKNRLLFSVLFLLLFIPVYAAEVVPKIGYLNLDYVMNLLPDAKQAETDLKAFELQLRSQLEKKATNFQEKLQVFQKEQATLTETVKNKKEQELQQLHNEIEQLQLESQNSMSEKQLSFIKPMYEKVQKVVEEVAKESKYTHVLNANVGGAAILLYGHESYDLTNLVLKKLGIILNAAGKKEEVKSATKNPAPSGKPNVQPRNKK